MEIDYAASVHLHRRFSSTLTTRMQSVLNPLPRAVRYQFPLHLPPGRKSILAILFRAILFAPHWQPVRERSAGGRVDGPTSGVVWRGVRLVVSRLPLWQQPLDDMGSRRVGHQPPPRLAPPPARSGILGACRSLHGAARVLHATRSACVCARHPVILGGRLVHGREMERRAAAAGLRRRVRRVDSNGVGPPADRNAQCAGGKRMAPIAAVVRRQRARHPTRRRMDRLRAARRSIPSSGAPRLEGKHPAADTEEFQGGDEEEDADDRKNSALHGPETSAQGLGNTAGLSAFDDRDAAGGGWRRRLRDRFLTATERRLAVPGNAIANDWFRGTLRPLSLASSPLASPP